MDRIYRKAVLVIRALQQEDEEAYLRVLRMDAPEADTGTSE